MSSSSATVPWAGMTPVLLDDMYRFRSIDFPDMQWPPADGPTTFAHARVAAAPFGGFIAVCDHSSPNDVSIYTSAGRRVSSFDVLPDVDGDTITFLCWNERRDHLIILMARGGVSFHNSMGALAFPDRTLPSTPIANLCASTRNGFVAYCDDSTLILLQLRGGEYVQSTIDMSEYFPGDLPSAILVIPDDVSMSRGGAVEVILATTEDASSLYRVIFKVSGEARVEQTNIVLNFCVKLLALSPSGEKIAIAGEKGQVGCTNAALSDFKPMVETLTGEAPGFLAWLGEHTVAFTSPEEDPSTNETHISELFFFSPLRGYHGGTPDLDQVDVPDGAFFLTEPDGIRSISGLDCSPPCAHRFFQVIEDCAVRLYYKFGSKMAAALLRKAYDQYIEGDAESVATMRQVTGGSLTDDAAHQNLTAAIQDALATAGFEFDVAQQKRLLRIAAYGKSFCPTFDSHEFVVRCKKIRALHAIRAPDVGMMLTMRQLECLPPDRLAKRLTDRGHYQLAFEIAKALGGRCEIVMTSWAIAKMNHVLIERGLISSTDFKPLGKVEDASAAKELDESLNRILMSNMKKAAGLSFISIAKEARERGREHLSIRLLEQEPSATNRVQALMQYGLIDQALAQAVESGDAGLVFECLINLSRTAEAFYAQVKAIDVQRKDSTASDLAYVYLTHFGSATLKGKGKELLQRPHISLNLQLMQYFDAVQSYNAIAPDKRLAMYDTCTQQINSTIESATDACRNAVTTSTREGDKESASEFAQVERALSLQQTLHERQLRFAHDFSDLRFLNKSVIQTMQLCWELSVRVEKMEPQAQDFAKYFKLSEKQVQWAKLRGYEACRTEAAVDAILGLGGIGKGGKLTNAKTVLPVSAFIEALLRMGRSEHAAQFVPKLANVGERLEAYVQCQAWSHAAHECVRSKEQSHLDMLKRRAAHFPGALDQIKAVTG